MKITYVERKFSSHVMQAIDAVITIIAEYTAEGYRLTLRQLYYQFVARDTFPNDRRWTWTGHRWLRDPDGTKNAQPNYKWLGGIVSDGRLAGLIDWDAIEDRTRNLKLNNHWRDPQHLLTWAADGYGFDLWGNQPERVEVWVEKEALAGVIERPATEWDVSWFCCRGYVSQSELWAAGRRLGQYINLGQTPTVIHLGDHDPSGMDMTRDIFDRLELFVGGSVNVERIALNMDQVEEHNPPPNPAKLSDSRAGKYVAQFGDDSWELDALDPRMLTDLIDRTIEAHCDKDLLDEARAKQKDEREQIRELAETFDA